MPYLRKKTSSSIKKKHQSRRRRKTKREKGGTWRERRGPTSRISVVHSSLILTTHIINRLHASHRT
jgi:hypothetical protein